MLFDICLQLLENSYTKQKNETRSTSYNIIVEIASFKKIERFSL